MSATSAAPVASVFASSATATLPPARRSPMIPEPTDRRAEQRGADRLRRQAPAEAGLPGAAHTSGLRARTNALMNLPSTLRARWPPRRSRTVEKLAGVLRPVDARGLHVDGLEASLAELGPVLRFPRARRPRSRSTARRSRRITAGTSPRTTTSETAKPAAGLEHAKRFGQHAILVGREIDDAVGDDHVHRVLSGSGMASISPFRNSTLLTPAFALVLAGQRRASRRSCRGRTPCRWDRPAAPTAARRCRRPIRDRAPSPRLQLGERRRVAAAERRGHRFRRQLGGLAVRVESPRSPDRTRSRRGGAAARAVSLLTRRAACPYFSFTSSLMLSSAIAGSPQIKTG